MKGTVLIYMALLFFGYPAQLFADEYDARIDARLHERDQIREIMRRDEREAAKDEKKRIDVDFEALFQELRLKDALRQAKRVDYDLTTLMKK